MQILILNASVLNGGDAAILVAEVEMLRTVFGPAVRIVALDRDAKVATSYYPEINFRESLFWFGTRGSRRSLSTKVTAVIRSYRFRIGAWMLRHRLRRCAACFLNRLELEALFEIRRSDLVVNTGGTMFLNHYYLPAPLLEPQVAMSLGRPLVFFTHSLERLSRRSDRVRLGRVMRRALAVFVRGDGSRDEVLSLGAKPASVVVGADPAFALADPDLLGVASHTPTAPLRIAISVRDLPGSDESESLAMRRYLRSVAAVCEHLVDRHGASVTFLSTCQGIPEYPFDDSQIAREVANLLPAHIRDHVHVDRGFHPPATLRDRYADHDLVIATRLHAAILAVAAGTPVLPIAYEPKTDEVFASLGFSGLVQKADRLDPHELCRTVDSMIQGLPKLNEMFARAAALARTNAERDAKTLHRVFQEAQAMASQET